jgi:predicted ferric reductase
MNDKLYWYVARAGGLMAWWLLGAGVVCGLILSTRIVRKRPSPKWMLDMHRFVGGLATIFVAAHIAGLMADHFIHFGPDEVLVPLSSTFRPVAVAWGVVGMYLLVAIEVTSLAMRRLPRRVWRWVHSSSFPLFVLTSVHAVAAGTDHNNVALQWSALLLATLVLFLVLYRALASVGPARAPARRGA